MEGVGWLLEKLDPSPMALKEPAGSGQTQGYSDYVGMG